MKGAMPKNMEFINCEICGANDEHEIFTRDRDGSYLRTVICKKCGLVYTNPRPVSSEIERYYERLYRFDYKGVYQPKKRHILRGSKIAAKRIQQIKDYIFPGMRTLDVGSGSGEMVYTMRSMGVICDGLEPNKGYAFYTREVLGLPVSCEFIENSTLPENFYDIVTMYHVIEHLHSPLRTLCNIHSCLKPDGVLVVECPNIEAHCQTPSNRLHRAHLYYFNEVTLRALGEKAGFEAIKMITSSDGGNILSIFRKMHNKTIAVPDLSYNYNRVMDTWTSHTKLKYYLSPYPYKRLVNKGAQILSELLHTLLVEDRLTLLEKTLKKPLPSPSHEKQHRWLYKLAVSLTGIMILFLSLWTARSLMDHSDEIMALIKEHQDGNDLFVIMHHERLKNIKPASSEVIIFNATDELRVVLVDIVRSDTDLHLIVEDDHLHHIQDIAETVMLKSVQIISLGSNNYHLLTTETHYGSKL